MLGILSTHVSSALLHSPASSSMTKTVYETVVPIGKCLSSAITRRHRHKMPPKSYAGIQRDQKDQVKMSPVCTNCREKHLKCTGAPLCVRCRREGTECIFVPSRRGKRPPKGRSPTPESAGTTGGQTHLARTLPSSSTPHLRPSSSNVLSTRSPSPAPLLQHSTPDRHGLNSSMSLHFINLAYEQELATHFFVLPKHILLNSVHRLELQCLRIMIEYIGMSHDPPNQAMYAGRIEQMLFSQQFPQNAYTVQAYLLLAIKLSSAHDPRATQCLHWASTYAYQIGMNRDNFASLHSGGSQEQEDSWASTWTVLLQLCQMWSINDSRSPGQQGAATMIERRSSLEVMQGPQHTYNSTRHPSISSAGQQSISADPSWAGTSTNVPWMMPTSSHAELPEQSHVYATSQQPRSTSSQILPQQQYPPGLGPTARHALPFQNIENYLLQFPRP